VFVGFSSLEILISHLKQNTTKEVNQTGFKHKITKVLAKHLSSKLDSLGKGKSDTKTRGRGEEIRLPIMATLSSPCGFSFCKLRVV
jgi:hypothetical protein